MFRFPNDRVFFIAEIGVNHNGSVEIAKKLIDVAVAAGCDAVKFQKRTPLMHVKPELWNVLRSTPWGPMTHSAYRKRIELGPRDYLQIVEYCAQKNIIFSASPWDNNAADTVYALGAPFIKIASASVTNLVLLNHVSNMGRPVVMSTGMSTAREIADAVEILTRTPQLALLVCTSKYPAPVESLNLRRIYTLQGNYPFCLVGYSGHEVGLWTTLAAVAMGARIIERHITLDRSMIGSDHAASIEPQGLIKLLKEIRNFEKASGSGILQVQECEQSDIERLRGAPYPLTGATRELPCEQ